ncbi:MAG TPA: hypothetical protein VF669_08405 [Tepidisphaeraceae bacterium]|jgi:hypothetical protein
MRHDAKLRSVVWVAGLLVVGSGLFAATTTSPATAPVDQIISLHLQDPINGSAKCFLDLDTGTRFPFERYNDAAFVREQGVDVMCETRTPADGFVIYDLTLLDFPDAFEAAPEYETLRHLFDGTEIKNFEMMGIKTSLPKRYLFRTRDGAMGVLEFTAITDAPAGLDLRYRIIPRPQRPLPPPPHKLRIVRKPIDRRLADAEVELQTMRLSLGEKHPLYLLQKKQIEMLKEAARTPAKDPVSQRLQDAQLKLKTLRLTLGSNHRSIQMLEHEVIVLKRKVAEQEKILKPATLPTTLPAIISRQG